MVGNCVESKPNAARITVMGRSFTGSIAASAVLLAREKAKALGALSGRPNREMGACQRSPIHRLSKPLGPSVGSESRWRDYQREGEAQRGVNRQASSAAWRVAERSYRQTTIDRSFSSP